jgi:hypothetical protein
MAGEIDRRAWVANGRGTFRAISAVEARLRAVPEQAAGGGVREIDAAAAAIVGLADAADDFTGA